ncbi:MAG TPA: hypothetical protein VHB79_21565 [Polyangiaceae bacterium]|nr:hypothetical protein [Polyangiaceae bacterium]
MRSLGRRLRTWWALPAVALVLSGACTFPDYSLLAPAAAGSGGAMSGGRAGSSSGGTTLSDGGNGAEPTSSDGGVNEGGGGEGGEPMPVDIGPCGQRSYALHCYDHKKNDDETDVDCGGSRCASCAADESCSDDRDCSSGTCTKGSCTRALTLQYLHLTDEEETASFRFRALLGYTATAPIALKDITLRYFFSRNSVMEPILPGGASTRLPKGDDISGDTEWRIGRMLRGDGISSDAYLEIGFINGKILNTGDSLDLTASAVTGDAKTLFNQQTHFSFDAETALHESKKLAVYFKGKRVWGNGPPVSDPPSCLKVGVNLDGPALTIDGQAWEGSPASLLARYLNDQVVFKPAIDKGREDMLRAGFFFHDDSFVYPVESGDYALVAYAWSADGGEAGTLSAQDQDLDAFRAQSFAGGGPWVPLGPYRVSITSGELKLGANGDLRVGGFELRTLDEP